MELQEVEKHNGVHTSLAEDVSQLLKLMVSSSWVGSHSCASKNDCVFCESSVMWHQLALQLVEFLSPDHPVNPPDVSNTSTSISHQSSEFLIKYFI